MRYHPPITIDLLDEVLSKCRLLLVSEHSRLDVEHETGDLIELEEEELVEQDRDNDEDDESEHVEQESDLVLPDELDRDEERL